MTHQFLKVYEFNTKCDVYIPSTKWVNIFTDLSKDDHKFNGPETIQNAYALIKEECKELSEATEKNNKVAQLDACIDICYVVLGMLMRIGVKYEEFLKLYKNYIETLSSTGFDITCIHNALFDIDLTIKRQNYDDLVYDLIILYFAAIIIGRKLVLNYSSFLDVDVDIVFNDAFNTVHENNMSKICKTEKEAIRTVKEKYHNHLLYKTPSYRKVNTVNNFKCETCWVVFDIEQDKVLKSIEWKEVDLTKYIV